MSAESDVLVMIEQEKRLVFTRFDEDTAFAIGSSLRQLAAEAGQVVAVEIRFFNRPLFFSAMTGTNADNPDWLRRKGNTVRRWDRASYHTVQRWKRDNRVSQPEHNVDPTEYVAAGGAFPIRIEGVGVVGSIAVSGLPSREDHNLVVRAISLHLGIDPAELALPRE